MWVALKRASFWCRDKDVLQTWRLTVTAHARSDRHW